MHNLIEPVPDWFDFRQSVKTHLLRLSSLHHNRVLLWVVADGTRINAKLANAYRASDRDQAEMRMNEQLAAGMQPADNLISTELENWGRTLLRLFVRFAQNLNFVLQLRLVSPSTKSPAYNVTKRLMLFCATIQTIPCLFVPT